MIDILNLIKSGRIDTASVLTHQFGLDQVSKAIWLTLAAGHSLKPVILPEVTTTLPLVEIKFSIK